MKKNDQKPNAFSTMTIKLRDSIDREAFISKVMSVANQVLRIKGVVKFTGEQNPYLFQFHSGRFHFQKYFDPSFKDRFLIISSPSSHKLSLQW